MKLRTEVDRKLGRYRDPRRRVPSWRGKLLRNGSELYPLTQLAAEAKGGCERAALRWLDDSPSFRRAIRGVVDRAAKTALFTLTIPVAPCITV